MKGPHNNRDADIGTFLHDLEEENSGVLILSEFLKRKTQRRKMSKRAIAIAAYEAQKSPRRT